MSQNNERSTESVTEVLDEKTPTAQAMYDLRKRVFAQTVGPGAVTMIAEEVGIDRGNLQKVVSPAYIKKVAKVERALEEE